MPSVNDVAAFIEQSLGDLSAYKLQKLVYYAQAWSLAWDNKPLFANVIKAWTNGPVSPELWHDRKSGHRGNPLALSASDAETVCAVLDFYGPMNADMLIKLSHREAPWRDARKGLAPSAVGQEAITHEAMRAYYAPAAAGSEGVKKIPEAVARGVALLLATPETEIDLLYEEEEVDGAAATAWLEGRGADPWVG